jgi:hypothetical protein
METGRPEEYMESMMRGFLQGVFYRVDMGGLIG